jgi:diacylglycerol kinase
MSLQHPIPESLTYAFEGLKTAYKNEPNFRFHIVSAVIVLIAAFLLKFSAWELAILTLTIGFVLILELINTTLEALVDLVSPEIRKQAKIAKDVSAGAVLVSAILAITVGIILFVPKLF